MMSKAIIWSAILIAFAAPTFALAAPACPPPMTWDADIGICAGPKIDPTIRSGANLIFESAGIVGVVTQGAGGGCYAGYTFMGAWGGCVKQSQQSDSQSQSCGAGYTGTQTRVRYRTVYSHQNGGIQYGAWGAWGAWTGTCTPVGPPPPPPPPPPGSTTTVVISGMVCGAADPGYSSYPLVPAMYRTNIISTFRSWGPAGRCPARAGYEHYLGALYQIATDNGGTALAYSNAWPVVWNSMNYNATMNNEQGQGGIDNANAICRNAAQAAFGSYASSVYISGSGNKCNVTF